MAEPRDGTRKIKHTRPQRFHGARFALTPTLNLTGNRDKPHDEQKPKTLKTAGNPLGRLGAEALGLGGAMVPPFLASYLGGGTAPTQADPRLSEALAQQMFLEDAQQTLGVPMTPELRQQLLTQDWPANAQTYQAEATKQIAQNPDAALQAGRFGAQQGSGAAQRAVQAGQSYLGTGTQAANTKAELGSAATLPLMAFNPLLGMSASMAAEKALSGSGQGVDETGQVIARPGGNAFELARQRSADQAANLVANPEASLGDLAAAQMTPVQAAQAQRAQESSLTTPVNAASTRLMAPMFARGAGPAGAAMMPLMMAPGVVAAERQFSTAIADAQRALADAHVSGDQNAVQAAQQSLEGLKQQRSSTRSDIAGQAARGLGGAAAVGRSLSYATPAAQIGLRPSTWLPGAKATLGAMARTAPALPGVASAVGPGRALSTVKNLGRANLVSGAALSGVNSAFDLGRMALGDGSFQRENEAAVQEQTLLNQDRGGAGKAWDATKAGLGVLAGDVSGARRQFGASWGRILPESTPAGRVYAETQRELAATQSGQTAREQAINLLNTDPRFQGLDKDTVDQLANLAEQQGRTREQVVQFGGQPEDYLGDYGKQRTSGALDHLPPQAQELAGRNASLYHLFGRSHGSQLAEGNLPVSTEPGVVTYAPGGLTERLGGVDPTTRYAQYYQARQQATQQARQGAAKQVQQQAQRVQAPPAQQAPVAPTPPAQPAPQQPAASQPPATQPAPAQPTWHPPMQAPKPITPVKA